jgi:hypothetical protein
MKNNCLPVKKAHLPGTTHQDGEQGRDNRPLRRLTFLFFMLLIGGFTLKTASPDVSTIGKFSGGLFVDAMSIIDAYKDARIRLELWRHGARRLSQAVEKRGREPAPE